MRFSSRERTTDQRGFVLGAALLIAVLYFALMELLMLDATVRLREADRSRAHVIAAALAESGAELAAANLVNVPAGNAQRSDSQGTASGTCTRNGTVFDVWGEGTTNGVPPADAKVHVRGTINGTLVAIDFSSHSQ